MSAFKYQWNQTIDVGTAGLLSKQWTSIRHILSLLVTANACVHVTAYVAVRRSLSTTYTAVVLGLLLRQYVSYQFGVWAGYWVQRGNDRHCRHRCLINVFIRISSLLTLDTFSVIILGMASASEWRCHIVTGFLIGWVHNQDDHSGYGLSQCETMLHCNGVSDWLSPIGNRALLLFTYCVRMKVLISLKTKSCHNANFVVTSRHCRSSQIAKFMGLTWGPPGSCRPRWAPCWPH